MISAHPITPHERTVRLVVDNTGQSCAASLTENIWVHTHAFSMPTWGNKVEPLTTGKEYFTQLIEALRGAQQHIYITGWQVNWDAQLDDTGTRLFDILLEVARKGKVQIYVMPWDDTVPVQTYDDEAKKVLEAINDITKNSCVHVKLVDSLADSDYLFYSHHQKLVVVDNKTAFVGGIDLAYGRFDDEHYNLHPDAAKRNALNRYNGCVEQVGLIPDSVTIVDPKSLNKSNANDILVKKRGLQLPDSGERITLDAHTQPRMPWQDVHCKIVGPAAADLARNFVVRWNSEGPVVADTARKLGPFVPLLSLMPSEKPAPQLTLPEKPAPQPVATGCGIQVLRSASAKMCKAESDPIVGVQANITDAMIQLIDKAQHFIYIENQFFVSGFGEESGVTKNEYTGPAKLIHDDFTVKSKIWGARKYAWSDVDEPPQNQICEHLGNKIKDFILHHPEEPFHVYITLPVHPEGELNDGSIMTQVYWTMQTLVLGSQSLMNRIRRALKARELIDKNDPGHERVFLDGNTEFETIPPSACDKYLTLLNLRNWAKIGDRYVTEQVYIHSKFMIVDDRHAILGSANINDRSQLGSRDSELAVLVVDSEEIKADLCGDSKQRPTRGFARKLRMAVWEKIFGITAGGNKAATELKHAVESPGSPESWQAIQKRASTNTAAYEAVFDFIPRDKDLNGVLVNGDFPPASIWPRWHKTDKKDKDGKPIWAHSGHMPFEAEFWKAPQFNAQAIDKLKDIKGFITRLPIDWTRGENNNLGYPPALVAKNEINVLPVKPATTQMADNTINETPEEPQT